jgi:hypothetical protein
MTVSYTWKIEQLDVTPAVGELSDVVRRVHWRLLASDGSSEADVFGMENLGTPTPEAFIAYPSLVEADVIGWLEETIDAKAGEDEPSVEGMKQGLAGILAARAADVVAPAPLPWA